MVSTSNDQNLLVEFLLNWLYSPGTSENTVDTASACLAPQHMPLRVLRIWIVECISKARMPVLRASGQEVTHFVPVGFSDFPFSPGDGNIGAADLQRALNCAGGSTVCLLIFRASPLHRGTRCWEASRECRWGLRPLAAGQGSEIDWASVCFLCLCVT